MSSSLEASVFAYEPRRHASEQTKATPSGPPPRYSQVVDEYPIDVDDDVDMRTEMDRRPFGKQLVSSEVVMARMQRWDEDRRVRRNERAKSDDEAIARGLASLGL